MFGPQGSPLTPQMGPTGAQSPATPDPGMMADSLSKIGMAVQILQSALPGLPVGDEMQKAVIDAVQKLSKVAPASAQVPGVQATQLRGLQGQAEQSQMLSALLRNIGAGASRPNSPGGGAALSPPGAPAGGMM